MGDHDELGDELKREWFAGRVQQIHEELTADFDRYIAVCVEQRAPGAGCRRARAGFVMLLGPRSGWSIA